MHLSIPTLCCQNRGIHVHFDCAGSARILRYTYGEGGAEGGGREGWGKGGGPHRIVSEILAYLDFSAMQDRD